MQKGIKIRLYPNKEQINKMNSFFGCRRYVYNYFLDYSSSNKDYSYYSWSKELTSLKQKEDTLFLKEVDKFILQNSLKDLRTSYNNFFIDIKKEFTSKKGFNKPKYVSKKNTYQSFRTNYTNNNIEILSKHIKLPKLGLIKCKYHYSFNDVKIISVTVTKTPSNKYYASIIHEVDINPLVKTNKEVGIDVGVRNLVTTSDNVIYVNPLKLDKIEKKITRLQRRISKTKVDSSNRKKLRIKKAKIEEHKVNIINDYIHKITSSLIKEYDTLYIEDLDIKELITKQVVKRNKRKLISTCIGKLIKVLEYKSKMYEKQIHKIDRYYPSSKTCSRCNNTYEVKDSRIYQCPYCSLKIDRDYNASLNILRYGQNHN